MAEGTGRLRVVVWRTAIVLAASLPLSGCSYIYDLIAANIDGELSFASLDREFDCVSSIYVATTGKKRAEPLPQDDVGLVENRGAYWWVSGSWSNCETPLPLQYGSHVVGTEVQVFPKDLAAGQTYTVSTSGDGANGFGCFEIMANGVVNNLPHDRCLRQVERRRHFDSDLKA